MAVNPPSPPNDGCPPAHVTRRRLLRVPAALAAAAALFAGGWAPAAACAPRGAGCSVLRPCCDGSPCRFFGANPFVGVCAGRGVLARLRGHGTLWPARRHTLFTEVTCDDFDTRREVRRFVRRNPGFDTSRLDENDDGRLCRHLPTR